MAVQIQIDQPGSGAPPGIPGQAREDLATGFAVQLTATGGPFLAYQWSIVDKAVDIMAGLQSAALLSAPAAAVTQMVPIDFVGTYLVQVVVDSGSGLGANADDVARITFYAGTALNSLNPVPNQLPRRQMAFRETTEHNVPDAVFPLGNPRGWAQEWERWFARLLLLSTSSYFAAALVDLPAGGPAVLTAASNVASAVRLSLGVVAISFTNPASSTDYVVLPSAEGQGGMFLVRNKTVNGFVIERSDLGGSLVDDDFGIVVEAM